MKTVEERLENLERIIIHKFGTLDLDEIRERDEAFFKEANERMAKINEKLDRLER